MPNIRPKAKFSFCWTTCQMYPLRRFSSYLVHANSFAVSFLRNFFFNKVLCVESHLTVCHDMLIYICDFDSSELSIAPEDFHIKTLFVVYTCFEKVTTSSQKGGHVASLVCIFKRLLCLEFYAIYNDKIFIHVLP